MDIYVSIKKVLLGKLANNSVSLDGCLGVLLKSMKTHLSEQKKYQEAIHSDFTFPSMITDLVAI